jgi:hypothetical protein
MHENRRLGAAGLETSLDSVLRRGRPPEIVNAGAEFTYLDAVRRAGSGKRN